MRRREIFGLLAGVVPASALRGSSGLRLQSAVDSRNKVYILFLDPSRVNFVDLAKFEFPEGYPEIVFFPAVSRVDADEGPVEQILELPMV